MKKHPNKIVHAPRTLQERDLEAINGGIIAYVDPALLIALQTQQQATQEQIAAVSAETKAGADTQAEINRNLK